VLQVNQNERLRLWTTPEKNNQDKLRLQGVSLSWRGPDESSACGNPVPVPELVKPVIARQRQELNKAIVGGNLVKEFRRFPIPAFLVPLRPYP
jgi:hypothetical protein